MLVHVGQALEDLVAPVANAALREELVAVLGHLVQVALLRARSRQAQRRLGSQPAALPLHVMWFECMPRQGPRGIECGRPGSWPGGGRRAAAGRAGMPCMHACAHPASAAWHRAEATLTRTMLASSPPPAPRAHQELEDEEELVVLSDDLLELDNAWVVELAQRLDLPQVHALLPRVELALHLLDSHLQATSAAGEAFASAWAVISVMGVCACCMRRAPARGHWPL